MTKKLLCVLLMLAMILSVITACTPNTDPKDTDTESESTAEETSSEEETSTEGESAEEETTTEEETAEEPEEEPTFFVPLVENGVSKIVIVYPASYKDYERSAAETLAAFLEEKSGVKSELLTDAAAVADGKMEILVGDTARTDAAMRSSALINGKYAVQLSQTRLIVNGAFAAAIDYAVEKIQTGIVKHGMEQSGSLLLPDTALDLTYVPPLQEYMLTFGNATLKNVLENGKRAYLIYFENATATDFTVYYTWLMQYGLESKEEPRMMLNAPNNYYAMCSDGKVMVTFVLTTYNRQARVFVERVEDNGYYSYENTDTEAICEPLFFHVGTGQEHGQCEIFRFSNGTFFIVDGGLNDDSAQYAAAQNGRRIVEILKTYAPDPQNIRIAGWLLTHVHEDHTGAIQYFCKHYGDDPTIKVENILYNNYSDLVIWQKEDDAAWVVPLVHRVEALLASFAETTGASIHKVHPGQILHFGDAKLEIVYTHELRIASSKLTSINGLSVVSLFTVAGQTFMITGDTTTKSNLVMEAMYGEFLRADFYQTPHHGYGGNTETLAENVDPKWVLWPCNDTRYEVVRVKAHNAYLFSSSSRVENHFVARHQTYLFHLPFTGSNYTVTENTVIE